MSTIFRTCLCTMLLCLASTMGGISVVYAESKVIYSMDFGRHEGNDAPTWLKKRGFDMLLDADRLHLTLENGGLKISTDESLAGMFALKFGKEDHLPEVTHVVVEWGVNRFPKGANWDEGTNRVPVAIMFSFGDKKLSSGLPFGVNAAPYFLSPFIGEKEQVGKMYTGKLYEEGGRYFCVSNGGPPVGKTIATKFEVEDRFKEVFQQDKTPPITGFAFQMNTDDTEGGAEAFIQKIVFYSN